MDAQERELERLKAAVEQAKALYQGAKTEQIRALQRMQELGATHPDGSIRHATSVYNFTLKKYSQALHEFNRYILDRNPSI